MPAEEAAEALDDLELDAAGWDLLTATGAQDQLTATEAEPVWAVKFYSNLCGSCREFLPTWEEGREAVALRYGTMNVDDIEVQKIAHKLGVLEEGIPNVKLVVGAELTPVVTGDTPDVEAFTASLRQALSSIGATPDAEGYYVRGGARVEL